MLDLKFVVENPELVKKAMSTRSGSYDVDAVLNLDKKLFYAKFVQLPDFDVHASKQSTSGLVV